MKHRIPHKPTTKITSLKIQQSKKNRLQRIHRDRIGSVYSYFTGSFSNKPVFIFLSYLSLCFFRNYLWALGDGATIAIGLLLGCEKKEIIRFSFLILLLPVLGASTIKLFEYYATATSIEFTISPLALIVSFFSAFISGYFCCRFVRYAVFHAKLHYFAIYCFLISFLLFFFA